MYTPAGLGASGSVQSAATIYQVLSVPDPELNAKDVKKELPD